MKRVLVRLVCVPPAGCPWWSGDGGLASGCEPRAAGGQRQPPCSPTLLAPTPAPTPTLARLHVRWVWSRCSGCISVLYYNTPSPGHSSFGGGSPKAAVPVSSASCPLQRPARYWVDNNGRRKLLISYSSYSFTAEKTGGGSQRQCAKGPSRDNLKSNCSCT